MPRFLKYSLVLLLPLFLISCREQFHWRQKLTVTVETPAGEVSGASVSEVFTRAVTPLTPDANAVEASFRGEAVVIEIAPDRYMFALISNGMGWADIAYDVRKPRTKYEDNMRHIMDQIGKPPVPMPEDSLPLLITFDDIADPTTVRRVDPDDLDDVFGCDRAVDPALMPWRAAGQTYRDWAKAETLRLANAEAAARAGITGEAAAVLQELNWIVRPDHAPNAAEEARITELQDRFTPEQQQRWFLAFQELVGEIPGTLPTPAAIAARVGGQCHSLTSVTIQITDEPVTEGRVEAVLGWIIDAQYITPPEQQPEYVKDQTAEQKLMSSDFIDWRTIQKRREESE